MDTINNMVIQWYFNKLHTLNTRVFSLLTTAQTAI